MVSGLGGKAKQFFPDLNAQSPDILVAATSAPVKCRFDFIDNFLRIPVVLQYSKNNAGEPKQDTGSLCSHPVQGGHDPSQAVIESLALLIDLLVFVNLIHNDLQIELGCRLKNCWFNGQDKRERLLMFSSSLAQ